ILYRLVSRGSATGIPPKRDGVVHPLLAVWREETEDYCRANGLAFRVDSSNRETKRGLIRDRVLPLLRELHVAADANILRALDARETLPPALAELLASPAGSNAARWSSIARCGGAAGGFARTSQGLGYGAGSPATGSQAGRRRSRTCSSTQRSRGASARRGPSSCAATR